VSPVAVGWRIAGLLSPVLTPRRLTPHAEVRAIWNPPCAGRCRGRQARQVLELRQWLNIEVVICEGSVSRRLRAAGSTDPQWPEPLAPAGQLHVWLWCVNGGSRQPPLGSWANLAVRAVTAV